MKRALKSLIRRLFFDRHYYDALEAKAGKPLRDFISRVTFVKANPNGKNYPLDSNSFDLIVSNAVQEHVVDIPFFASELKRLLMDGGYFYAIIHNFSSISGGHHIEWAFPDEYPSKKVPPWDHLRKNIFPVFTYLNHLRPEKYFDAFNQQMEILLFEGRDIKHDRGGLEGERFLVPEIAEELKKYPRELLLTRSWCLICRKGIKAEKEGKRIEDKTGKIKK